MRKRWISVIFTAVAVLAFSPEIIAQTTQQPQAAQVKPIRRTPDGKPDFSGIWKVAGNAANSFFQTGIGAPRKNRKEMAKELSLTPFGKEEVERITKQDGAYAGEFQNPDAPKGYSWSCGDPPGPANLRAVELIELIQSPKRLLLITEDNTWIRQMWIGQEHPKDRTDYEPTWMGHSVAKWDGDTLVVDTIRVKAEKYISLLSSLPLEQVIPAPYSDQLHMVERFHMVDSKTLRIDRTFEDPKVYTRPWSASFSFEYHPEWKLGEDREVCKSAWPEDFPDLK